MKLLSRIFAVLVFLISLNENSFAKQKIEEIVLMGLNDFHGNIMPLSQSSVETNGQTPQKYQIGGIETLSGFIRNLREEYGRNFLLLDAGDEWQGTLESNSNKGSVMVELFNKLGVDAATIGNHEFDFGPLGANDPDTQGNLKYQISKAQYPYVSANIFDRVTQLPVQYPNLKSRYILKAGQVKVGVVGLTTQSTPETSSVSTPNLNFKNFLHITLEQIQKAKAEGAEVIVLLAHAGGICQPEPGQTLFDNKIRMSSDVQGTCDEESEIASLLKYIPKGTVNAVIAGHTHTFMHHWISGVPVIESEKYGKYFHLIKIKYDLAKHQVLSDKTEIQGPVAVCNMVFESQNNCDGKSPAPAQGRGALVPNKFLGRKILPDPQITAIVSNLKNSVKAIADEIVGESPVDLSFNQERESILGDLVVQAMKEKTHSDFAIITWGGIRSSISKGIIRYKDVYKVMPFDNNLVTITLKGDELKQLIEISQADKNTYSPMAGLKVNLVGVMDSGKVISSGKVRSIQTSQGESILSDKEYTLTTTDFLARGGDGWSKLVKTLPKNRFKNHDAVFLRDVIKDYIKQNFESAEKSKTYIDHLNLNNEVMN